LTPTGEPETTLPWYYGPPGGPQGGPGGPDGPGGGRHLPMTGAATSAELPVGIGLVAGGLVLTQVARRRMAKAGR
jgi:hypothetical protein